MKLSKRYEVIGLDSQLVKPGEQVFEVFKKALEKNNVSLRDNDILVIASKVFSYEENRLIKLDDIKPSKHAEWIAKQANMDPRIAELVIRESNNQIVGWVYHVLLAYTGHGLSANAGIDQSNAPPGYVLLLPKNPVETAKKFMKKIKRDYNVKVGVIIIDSRTIPLRRGTSAIALGVAGIPAIIDERGERDIYGYEMMITTRALADNIGTAATLIMGETSEKRPFAIVRGLGIEVNEELASIAEAKISPQDCLYVGPLYEQISKKINYIRDEKVESKE